MDFKEIYRGPIIRSTTNSPYLLNRREFSVFVTYSAGSINGVEQAFRAKFPTIQRPMTIGNNFLMVKVNSPVTGAAIIMNVCDEDKASPEIACERLRAAFYKLTREYATELCLTPDIKEDAWLDHRYLEMYEDAADNLRYELAE